MYFARNQCGRGESHKLSSSSSYLSELVSCSSSSCSVCLLVLRRLFCEKGPFVFLYHLFSLNLNYIEAVTTNLLCYVQVKAPNLSIDQLSVRCSLPGCLLHRSLPLCRPYHLICTGSDIARRTHGYPVLSDTWLGTIIQRTGNLLASSPYYYPVTCLLLCLFSY